MKIIVLFFKWYFKELYGVMYTCHSVLFIWDHIKIYAYWSPPAWPGISSISSQSLHMPYLYYTKFLPWNLIMTSYSSFCSEDLSSRLYLPQLVISATSQTTLWFVVEVGSKSFSSNLGSYFIRWASEGFCFLPRAKLLSPIQLLHVLFLNHLSFKP